MYRTWTFFTVLFCQLRNFVVYCEFKNKNVRKNVRDLFAT